MRLIQDKLGNFDKEIVRGEFQKIKFWARGEKLSTAAFIAEKIEREITQLIRKYERELIKQNKDCSISFEFN